MASHDDARDELINWDVIQWTEECNNTEKYNTAGSNLMLGRRLRAAVRMYSETWSGGTG